MSIDLTKLSQTISHALRHAPEEYGLKLDDQGWVQISELFQALALKSKYWQDLTENDLFDMAAEGDTQRFEFNETRIRAVYGHSFERQIEYPVEQPPAVLFHGTTLRAATLVFLEGLKPMKRQYVHLSPDVETARQVALRRTPNPTLLRIDADAAFNKGVKFYRGNSNVWLAEEIPLMYIKVEN